MQVCRVQEVSTRALGVGKLGDKRCQRNGESSRWEHPDGVLPSPSLLQILKSTLEPLPLVAKKKVLVCSGFCCAAPSDAEGRNWLILLSLDHCPAMGKCGLPPRKKVTIQDGAISFLLLPSSSTHNAHFSPSKNQSKYTALEDKMPLSDGDGKEVGALSCDQGPQHSLPGNVPPGAWAELPVLSSPLDTLP